MSTFPAHAILLNQEILLEDCFCCDDHGEQYTLSIHVAPKMKAFEQQGHKDSQKRQSRMLVILSAELHRQNQR